MRGLRVDLPERPSEIALQDYSLAYDTPRHEGLSASRDDLRSTPKNNNLCILYMTVALLGVVALSAGIGAAVAILRISPLETRINALATLNPNASNTKSNPSVVRNIPVETEGEKCLSKCSDLIDDVSKNNRQIQVFMTQSSSLRRAVSSLRGDIVVLMRNYSNFLTQDQSEKARLNRLQESVNTISTELDRFDDFPFPYNGYIYSLTSTALTWAEAREECQSLGADLAVVGVRDYLTRVTLASALNTNEVWVGISDQAREGSWTWIDDSPATPSEIRWANSQPDNRDNLEHCGELWPITYLYRMNDEPCTNEQVGLCEKRFNG